MSGHITAETGTIGGFNIGTDLDATSGTLKLKGASGQITGSKVLFSGGKIGDFKFTNSEFVATQGGQNVFRIDLGTDDVNINGEDTRAIYFGNATNKDLAIDSQADDYPFIAATQTDNSRIVFRVGDANKFIINFIYQQLSTGSRGSGLHLSFLGRKNRLTQALRQRFGFFNIAK